MQTERGAIIVTGATGFLGRHFTQRLLAEGWRVHTLVPADGEWPFNPDQRLYRHVLDGTTEYVCRVFADVQPDAVVHLAAHVLAEHQRGDVAPLINANVLFGTQVLEGMRASACRRLVNVGTSWQHYNNVAYDPVCLYAATKQAFQDLIRYYVSAEGFRAASVELFDNYGADDERRKLVAGLVRTARTDECLVMSPGEQLLDLLHVSDVTEALLAALSRVLRSTDSAEEGRHEIFVVSSGSPVSVRQVVEAFEQRLGRKLNVRWGGRPYRRREVMTPWTAGVVLPAWRPRVSLGDGLAKVIEDEGLRLELPATR